MRSYEGHCRECGLPGIYKYSIDPRNQLCFSCLRGETNGLVVDRGKDLNPDVALKALRKESERVLLHGASALDTNDFIDTARALAQNFRDLDDWLSQQGYLPKAWHFPAEDENEED